MILISVFISASTPMSPSFTLQKSFSFLHKYIIWKILQVKCYHKIHPCITIRLDPSLPLSSHLPDNSRFYCTCNTPETNTTLSCCSGSVVGTAVWHYVLQRELSLTRRCACLNSTYVQLVFVTSHKEDYSLYVDRSAESSVAYRHRRKHTLILTQHSSLIVQ